MNGGWFHKIAVKNGFILTIIELRAARQNKKVGQCMTSKPRAISTVTLI